MIRCMNYFDVLEIPVSYKIDEQVVTRIYLEKQRKFHPDMASVTLDPFTATESVATSKIMPVYAETNIDSISACAASTVTLVNDGSFSVSRHPEERSDVGNHNNTNSDSAIENAYVTDNEAESVSSVTLVNEAYTVIMNPILRAEYFLRLNGIDPDAITASENAMEMLNISEQYESIDSDVEKEKFFARLNERMLSLLEFLYKSEDDIRAFSNNFMLLRFIKSFLEKVAPNAYSGN
ncbi:hypothetical protein FACS1894122_00610 [Alphaproteobacteria bacterium]|nr:hypothetical protein FACS1894122_00610 [Alphaproteobacteria bacterium]